MILVITCISSGSIQYTNDRKSLVVAAAHGLFLAAIPHADSEHMPGLDTFVPKVWKYNCVLCFQNIIVLSFQAIKRLTFTLYQCKDEWLNCLQERLSAMKPCEKDEEER